MLVLAHADAFRVNLDEFGQRVLQAAGNAGGAAQAHVHIGQLLAGVFAGGVNGCARFADDDFFNGGQGDAGLAGGHFVHVLDEVARQFVGLAAGRAVANGDELHAVLRNQARQGVDAAVPVAARLVRVDSGGFQQLAGGVHHGHFHAGANAGVQPHDGPGPGGGGQQQIAQVVGKNLDGDFFGFFAQAGEQVALGREAELDAPGPGHAFAQQIIRRAALVAPAQVQGDAAFGQARFAVFGQRGDEAGLQHFKLPPAKDGQRAVAGHAAHGFGVVEIVAELGHFGVGLVLASGQLALQLAFLPEPFAQALHEGGVFGPALGQDVAHAIEHGGNGGEVFAAFAFFSLHKRLGGLRGVQRGVGPKLVGQRLHAEFTRNLRLGAPFGLVGQIQIFQLLLGGRGFDGGAQIGRELALLLNAFEDGGAALVQLAQIAQAHLQLAQLGIVQPARGFLAVAGDEGHGGAAIQQVNGGLHLRRAYAEFGGNLKGNGHGSRGRKSVWHGRRLCVSLQKRSKFRYVENAFPTHLAGRYCYQSRSWKRLDSNPLPCTQAVKQWGRKRKTPHAPEGGMRGVECGRRRSARLARLTCRDRNHLGRLS